MKRAKEPIPCRTKTGSKVHLAHPGASVTFCGHWLRFQAEQTRVHGPIRESSRCEKCWGKMEEERGPQATKTTPTIDQYCRLNVKDLTGRELHLIVTQGLVELHNRGDMETLNSLARNANIFADGSKEDACPASEGEAP